MRASPWSILSVVLLAAGILFYLAMGMTYASWTDIGVYSVTITLIGFGLFGLLASWRTRPA